MRGSPLLLLILGVLAMLFLSVVLRHALIVLPFVLTGWYWYWRSGGDEKS